MVAVSQLFVRQVFCIPHPAYTGGHERKTAARQKKAFESVSKDQRKQCWAVGSSGL